MKCTLCDSDTSLFMQIKDREYLKCKGCQAVLLDQKNYLNKAGEKKRYQDHNNDVEDKGYQAFVSPIVRVILKDYNKDHRGLDFGAGPGPVIAKMLKDQAYNITLYDPFFANYPERLESQYDYIVCCEVIEHFYHPKEEFRLLKSLLKPGGTLYLKTSLYEEEIDFKTWYYKDDATHVFFYKKETLEWIKGYYGFSHLIINNKMIILGGKI